jgi:transcriptional regulator with XRE-family HTH domain
MSRRGRTLDQVFEEDLKNDDFQKALRLKSFSNELRAQIINRRGELGMTQADLAKASGTFQSRISRIESGDFKLREDTIVKLAEALQAEAVIRLIPIHEKKFTINDAEKVYSLFSESILAGFPETIDVMNHVSEFDYLGLPNDAEQKLANKPIPINV